MARSAAQIFEVELCRPQRSRTFARPVTLNARNCQMPPRQGEACREMLRQLENRGFESPVGVAAFALILIRWTPELPIVNIRMTCRTIKLPYAIVHSIHAFNMAFGARHIGVARLQRKVRACVFRSAESRRGETVDLVARTAVSAIGPVRKLATMRIFLVTIRAKRVGHRVLEFCASMAQLA